MHTPITVGRQGWWPKKGVGYARLPYLYRVVKALLVQGQFCCDRHDIARPGICLQGKVGPHVEGGRVKSEREKSREGALTWEVAPPLGVPQVNHLTNLSCQHCLTELSHLCSA